MVVKKRCREKMFEGKKMGPWKEVLLLLSPIIKVGSQRFYVFFNLNEPSHCLLVENGLINSFMCNNICAMGRLG